MSEWISVNDPPDMLDWYVYMLVYCQSKGTGEPCPIGIARYTGGTARYTGEWELLNETGADSELQYQMLVEEITHWMPMPPIPEVK